MRRKALKSWQWHILSLLQYLGHWDDTTPTPCTLMALLLEQYIHLDFLRTNDNQHFSDMDNLLFLSSCNQKCSGAWFVCASLPRPYKYMSNDVNFLCELILLMGATSKTYTLHTPEIHFYHYSLRKDLSPKAITKAFDECSSSSGFISRIFDMTIWSAPHKKMHIRYLNQIYGQTYPSWKVIPSLVTVSGKHYYQCRQGSDQWLLKTTLFKNLE